MAGRADSDEDSLILRQINVNRPTLAQTSSRQSIIAATEEYHLRPASSESNEALVGNSQRFSTPPSSPGSPNRRRYEERVPEPTTIAEHQASTAGFLPSTVAAVERMRGRGDDPSSNTHAMESSIGAADSEPQRNSIIRRKPVGSTIRPNEQRISQLNPDPGPPTPGLDDTPYIQFAIDQLTRDEEVGRGSRQYPAGVRGTVLEPSGGHGPNMFDTNYTAQDRGDRTSSRYSGDEAPYPDYAAVPAKPYVTDHGHTYGRPLAVIPGSSDDVRGGLNAVPSGEFQVYEDAHEFHTPAQIPQRTAITRVPHPIISEDTSATNHQQDVFVPLLNEISPLRFLPRSLRPLWLGLYLLLCLLVLAGLLFSGIYSSTHNGLFFYTKFGGARYFVFQYFPMLCAMVMLLWLFQIQVALQRVAPFIAMASTSSKARSEAPLLEYLPTQFLLPHLTYFRAGLPLFGIVMVIFWLQIFTIPLFACLYNVYYYGDFPNGQWRWTTTQGIVWTLFALFLLLFLALLALGIYLWRVRTGLKWDPRSLGDLVALLDRSNIVQDYANSELFSKPKDFRDQLVTRSDRLGFWTASRRPNDVFYGIGEEGGMTRRYSMEAGKVLEKAGMEKTGTHSITAQADLESEDVTRTQHRHLPWYIRPSIILLWAVSAIVLYLAFLIVSFVDQAVIRGFKPLTPVDVSANGFSSANFLYSFIPTLIAELLFLGWLSIDYAFRRLQPFAAMSSSEHGATAYQSLLLDYPAQIPIAVTLKALSNRDLRVAWFSFVSLIAACLPVFAGGAFWAQFYVPTQSVRIAVDQSGYYALCVFLALFVFSIPLAFFGLKKRGLPHACTTLAENISWLYASEIVGERDWRGPLGSRSEMERRLTNAVTEKERHAVPTKPKRGRSAESHLTGNLGQGRFTFGRFSGKDGRAHLGIERFGRGERRTRMTERALRTRPGSPSAEKVFANVGNGHGRSDATPQSTTRRPDIIQYPETVANSGERYYTSAGQQQQQQQPTYAYQYNGNSTGQTHYAYGPDHILQNDTGLRTQGYGSSAAPRLPTQPPAGYI